MTKLNKARKAVLRKVRKLVEESHWIQGKYEAVDSSGKFQGCLMGLLYNSLRDGAKGRKESFTDYSVVAQRLREEIKASGSRFREVEAWNDAKSRKRSDVLALIDKALEERGETK
jgi:hypothetical protein